MYFVFWHKKTRHRVKKSNKLPFWGNSGFQWCGRLGWSLCGWSWWRSGGDWRWSICGRLGLSLCGWPWCSRDSDLASSNSVIYLCQIFLLRPPILWFFFTYQFLSISNIPFEIHINNVQIKAYLLCVSWPFRYYSKSWDVAEIDPPRILPLESKYYFISPIFTQPCALKSRRISRYHMNWILECVVIC